MNQKSAAISLHTELGGSAEGFERACVTRDFTFPADHGSHPTFRNEWWYVTGNVVSDTSRSFGFHATFFRIANRPPTPLLSTATHSGQLENKVVDSNWSAGQFYMGHFAITEEGSIRSRAHERFARAAAGLAGARVGDLTDVADGDGNNEKQDIVRVWLDDWRLQAFSGDNDNELIWRLKLSEGNDAIDLTLRASKPVVLHGNGGLSQKSGETCNASFYYSIPRMRASGTLAVAGKTHQVDGSAWFDREWSSSALADNHSGWNWFSLQLADGRDLMLYQLRLQAGGIDPHSYAVEIGKAGRKRIVPIDTVQLTVERWWQSESGASYPVAGRLHFAETNETIVYRPLIDDQELQLTIRYWEGAIALSDEAGNAIGHGYLELTGYEPN